MVVTNGTVCCLQQRRRQLTECAPQWAELQEVLVGEETDVYDNRMFLDERCRRGDRRQVKYSAISGFVLEMNLSCSEDLTNVGTPNFAVIWSSTGHQKQIAL